MKDKKVELMNEIQLEGTYIGTNNDKEMITIKSNNSIFDLYFHDSFNRDVLENVVENDVVRVKGELDKKDGELIFRIKNLLIMPNIKNGDE